MQLTFKDSLNPALRVAMPLNDNAEEKSLAVLLTNNVVNTAIKPQTVNADVSSSQSEKRVENATSSKFLSALLDNEDEELNLEQKLQEKKLISVLENIFEIENLFYDEKALYSLTINDYPKKYFYLKLMISALYAQAALFSIKSRVSDLMDSIPKNNQHKTSQGRIALGIAITHLVNNKLIHQECLKRILSNDLNEIPEGMNMEETQKLDAGIRLETRKAKHRLSAHRRAYYKSLKAHDIPENDILENIPFFLSQDYLAITVRSMFPSLSIPTVKQLINKHIPISATVLRMEKVIDAMEKNEFKLIRAPVTSEFWKLLDAKLNRIEFNDKLFFFLLTSWQSDDLTKAKLNRDLMLAKNKNELIKQYKILSKKLFHQKFNLIGFKIVNYICHLANTYQKLMVYNKFCKKESHKLKKEMASITKELNTAYASIYNDYLSYLNAEEVKSGNVTQYNLKIENINEELRKLSECKDKTRIKRYAKRYTQFVYHVLLHFKENVTIDYLCVESIAKRIISNFPKIQEKVEAAELKNDSSLSKDKQPVTKKKKKKRKYQPLASPFAATAANLETVSTGLSKRVKPDRTSTKEPFQTTKSTLFNLSASLEEIESFPMDALIADLASSPISVNDFTVAFAKEPLDDALWQNQSVDNAFLPAKEEIQQIEHTHDSLALEIAEVDVKNIISTEVKSQHQLVNADEYWQILSFLISDENSSGSTNVAINQLVEAKRVQVAEQVLSTVSSQSELVATSRDFEQSELKFVIQNLDELKEQPSASSPCALNFKPQSSSSQQTKEEQTNPPRPLVIGNNQLTELFPNLVGLISLNEAQAELTVGTHLDLSSKQYE